MVCRYRAYTFCNVHIQNFSSIFMKSIICISSKILNHRKNLRKLIGFKSIICIWSKILNHRKNLQKLIVFKNLFNYLSVSLVWFSNNIFFLEYLAIFKNDEISILMELLVFVCKNENLVTHSDLSTQNVVNMQIYAPKTSLTYRSKQPKHC